MIELNDIKVFGANTLCMVLLKVQNVNTKLQAILLFMTIMYTIARIVTEVQKYNNNKIKQTEI
jgi:hypothetical protein